MLPGFVDAHTHVGVWGEGEGWSGQDTNELTDPVTAQVRALDAIYPADIGFTDALAGGITTVCVNPGSGNSSAATAWPCTPTAGRWTRWCCAPPPA